MTQKVNIQITGETSGFESAVNKAQSVLSSLSSSSTKSLSRIATVSATLGNVIGNVITKAFSSLSSSMDSVISRLDTLNNFPRVMSNLGISSTEAQKAIDYLSEKLVGLPTTLDDAASAVQRLTAMNGDIAASTEAYLALNNALLAGGASTDRQTEAMKQLSEAYAKGKPDAREYKVLMETMPAQMNQLAQSMGYVNAAVGGDFYNAMQDGTVSMDDFMAQAVKLNKEGYAEFQSFADQAENAVGGVETSITNLKTAITRGMANIMNTLGQSNIAGFFKNITSWVNTATKYVQAFVQVMMNAWNVVAKLFGGSELKSSNQALSGVESSVSDTSDDLEEATGNAKKLKQQLAGFDEMNVLKEDDSSSSNSSSSSAGIDTSNIDVSDFGNLAGEVDTLVNEIAEKLAWLQPIFEQVFTAGREAVAGIKAELDKVDWQLFAETLGNIITFVIECIGGIIEAWVEMYNKAAPLLNKVSKFLAEHGKLIGKIIGYIGGVKLAVKVLTPLLNGVKTAINGWKVAEEVISGLKIGIKGLNVETTGITDVFATIGTAIANPIETIKGLVSGLGSVFKNLWATITAHPIAALIAVIATLILTNDELRGKLMDILEKVITPVQNAIGALTPIIGEIMDILGELINSLLPPISSLLTIVGEILGVVMEVLSGIIALGVGMLLEAVVIVLKAIQPIIEGIMAVIEAILSPIEDLFKWLGSLLGVTNDTTEATEDLNDELSESAKEFDKDGDGALDYAENLSYVRSVIAQTNDAELDLIQAQKTQVEKYKDLNTYCKLYGKTAEELIKLHREGELGTIASDEALQDLTEAVINVEQANYKVESATEAYSEEQEHLQDVAVETKEKLDEAGRKLVELGEQGITSGEEWDKLTQEIKEYGEQIDETGKSMWSITDWETVARKAAENVADGAITGLYNKQSAWAYANERFAITGNNAFTSYYLIKSPSKLMKKSGSYIGEGAILGVKSQYGDFADTMAGLAEVGEEAWDNLALDDLELNVVARVDDSDVFTLADTLDGVHDAQSVLNGEEELLVGNTQNEVIVKIGEETLLDKIIDGINEQSSLRNRCVINV